MLDDVPFTTTIIMSVRDDISTSSLPSPSLDPSRFGPPSISVDVSKLLPEEKSDGAGKLYRLYLFLLLNLL